MATIPQIRQALADALEPLRAGIPDIQISRYWLVTPTPPTIDLWPGDPFQNGLTFGDTGEMFFTVRARVTTADTEAGQDLLDQLLEPATGITAALEADQTLGGVVDTLAVGDATDGGVTGYRELVEDTAVNGRLLGAEWRVKVIV